MRDTNELKRQGWEEPLDESPVVVPDRWHGGSVHHTGGGVWNRSWRSIRADQLESDDSPEQYFEVGYDSQFRGASVARYTLDEDGNYSQEEVVKKREATDSTDSACADVARELMREVLD